jgi:hypothetical protein
MITFGILNRFVTLAAIVGGLVTGLRATAASFEEVAPPPQDANAIKLSGKTENPNPETWLRMRGTNVPYQIYQRTCGCSSWTACATHYKF